MSKVIQYSIALIFLFIILFSSIAKVEGKKKKGNKIKVLLIDGQSKHHSHWKEWSPILLLQLNESGMFQIDIATSPMKGESLDNFNPKFRNYDVIVSTYNGDNWSARAQRNLEKFMTLGGGLVVVHAADNAFSGWEGYNNMIGLGGWENRTEKSGSYIFYNKNGDLVRDTSPGVEGNQDTQYEFLVETRSPRHPIMKDIPDQWLHVNDELYNRLRGPAMGMEILATAFSSSKYEGSERHEPVLMTVKYGEGRVFHTTMGHSKEALSCTGFITTFIRGCQWAADREVTFEVPEDFPTKDNVRSRSNK